MIWNVHFRRNPAGHLDHYYHFLFGGLIPLHEMITTTPGIRSVSLPQLGPMARHAEDFLRGHDIALMPGRPKNGKRVRLLGMDGGGRMRYRAGAIKAFSATVLARSKSLDSVDVLFVNRGMPSAEYLSQFPRRTEGAQRRSISNAIDIFHAMQDDGLHAHMAHLEGMSLTDQAALFRSAKVIIGQHGAGLSNAIFTSSSATVIEVAPAGRRHYRDLCSCLDIRYRWHGNGGKHVRLIWTALREQVRRMLATA